MRLWSKRFPEREGLPLLEEFNSSIREDKFLYWAEIESSKAYAKALHKSSVLTEEELQEILSGLDKVKKRMEKGEDLGCFEDIHSAVELLLIQQIGESGKKLHTGRSRNEQVATIERLYLKEKIPRILQSLTKIELTVIEMAEKYKRVIMPGYTHLQQAQCVLFSHYMMSLFWQVQRDKARLENALERVDTLPLGSGAVAGSSIELDREYMGEILGFSSVSENSMDAVSDRSFLLEVLFVLSLILLEVGRFCEDFIIFASSEFGYIEIDDSICTSSSLMPQKRNPDFFELIRASAGNVFGYLTTLFISMKGVPSAYNKDFQLDKMPLFNGIEETMKVLEVFRFTLKRIRPKEERILDRMSTFIISTDLVDYLVEKGLAFRDAHGTAGAVVHYAEKKNKQLNQLRLEELKRFSGLFDEDVMELFDFESSIKRKKTYGSTNPQLVELQIERAKYLLKEPRGV